MAEINITTTVTIKLPDGSGYSVTETRQASVADNPSLLGEATGLAAADVAARLRSAIEHRYGVGPR